jgi:hypothetical protein
MKSITLKMFLSYWVIMIGVNIASDFVAPEQMRRYPLIREAIRSAMLILLTGGGCAGNTWLRRGHAIPVASGDVLYISDTNGRMLCTDTGLRG